MYYNGKGINKSINTAWSWYRKSAANGLEKGIAALKEKFNVK